MRDSWFVEVKTSTGKALTIGTDYVSGSADLTERDNELIREAGKSLLAFVGEHPNQVNRPYACDCCEDWEKKTDFTYCPNCHRIF
jgi:hypothetical protein